MGRKDDYSDYEYIEGDVVMKAVFGDEEAMERIYNRYMGEVVKCIASIAHKEEIAVQTLPMEDLKQIIWCGVFKDIAGYRPK